MNRVCVMPVGRDNAGKTVTMVNAVRSMTRMLGMMARGPDGRLISFQMAMDPDSGRAWQDVEDFISSY